MKFSRVLENATLAPAREVEEDDLAKQMRLDVAKSLRADELFTSATTTGQYWSIVNFCPC
jgi:hypothetical protein